MSLLLTHPTGLPVEEPWYPVSNAEPTLNLVWSNAWRFCCDQLCRDQTSGVLQLMSSGRREPEWIDRLLVVVAIAVLVGSLQDDALSQEGLRRQRDPHWKRGMSCLRIGLATLQMVAADAAVRWMDWLPIPIQELEPCIPIRSARRKQDRAWVSTVELRPRPAAVHSSPLAVA